MRVNGNLAVEGSISVEGSVSSARRKYVKKADDETMSSAATQDIATLTALDFPATPDGSKRFKVSFHVQYNPTTTAGARKVQLHVGSNGNKSDTAVHTQSRPTSTLRVDTLSVHNYIVTPAANEKIGLSFVRGDAGDEVWGEASHPNNYSYMEVVEIAE